MMSELFELSERINIPNNGPCEVVITHFIYGSQPCGVIGTHKVIDPSTQEKVFICDEHFVQYTSMIGI